MNRASYDLKQKEKDKNNFQKCNGTKGTGTMPSMGNLHSSTSSSQNLSYYFSQFSGATSIHGIQYIGERGRFLIEKIIWTIVVSTLSCICIYLIMKSYNKWQTSPVLVSFSTTEMPIWRIPFPAVTICPEVKSNPEQFNFTGALLKKFFKLELSEEENDFFETLALVCNGASELIEMNNTSPTRDFSMFFVLAAIMPEFDELNITSIKWLGKELEWRDMLTPTFTDEGLCLSFNMLDYDEIFQYSDEKLDQIQKGKKSNKWSLENGYPDENSLESYPRRTFVSGIEGGLTIDGLTVNHSHLDYLCKESLQGYKVVLHHPSELPNMDKHFRVPLDQAVIVAIKPRMITVSENLLSYTPEAKKCFFSNERELKIFKSYSQQNCLTECLANYTISACGCLPFYSYNYPGNEICGPGKLECVRESKVNYLSNEDRFGKSCNCLPSCTALEYDVEITQTSWNWREIFRIFHYLGFKEELPDFEKLHISRLTVFYKEMQFLHSERNELYGYVDFFSSTGGLLGLFIGFSVTSAVEVLYFLTLRIICNIRKYGKRYWSGKQELINAQ